MNVPFYKHNLDANHAESIARVLNTPFLTSGAIGKAVEDQLCDFFNVNHALLSNSWTNGALATLLALNIKADDEVIVPAMTFIATANIVQLLGAKVVFADVDPDTLLITPEIIKAAISDKTRAVIPVHLYGQMCDIKGIRDVLCDYENIAIIEDAAHCFEGQRLDDYHDSEQAFYRPGKYSDAAIFSFYATKNITCGEGGAIICNNKQLANKIAKTRLHGMSAGAVDRFKKGAYQHWEMDTLGVKANLPDLLAALLPDQIRQVETTLKQRTRLANNYREAFKDTPIRVQSLDNKAISAEHIFPIHVNPGLRDNTINKLNQQGINVAVNYRAVHTMRYYQQQYQHKPEDFPVSQHWGSGTLSLPFYPSMTESEQGYVIDNIKKVIN